jgi:hypothetical protein
LQEPFESLDTRFDLNPLVRDGSGRLRQGDAFAISDSNHQERQILQVRFMKARNKAFHSHTELVSYFSQIHLNFLSRFCSTTSGDFGVSAFSFQKTTPIQEFELLGRDLGHAGDYP